MNSSKSENSALPSHLTNRATQEKSLAGNLTSTFESVPFSSPILDQFRGIMPDFNKRLSSDKNLGLSAGLLRLSPDTLPRLVSSSCTGIKSTGLSESVFENPKIPAGKGLEVLPDLPERTLTDSHIHILSADLPIAPLASRLVTLKKRAKETEKDRE